MEVVAPRTLDQHKDGVLSVEEESQANNVQWGHDDPLSQWGQMTNEGKKERGVEGVALTRGLHSVVAEEGGAGEQGRAAGTLAGPRPSRNPL